MDTAETRVWDATYLELDETPRELVPEPWTDWLREAAPTYKSLALGTRCAYDYSLPRGHRARIMPAEDAPRQGQEVASAYTRALLREFRPSSRTWHPFRIQQRDSGLLRFSAPFWRAAERPPGEWVIVDLRWAYWSIYSPATLDLLYNPFRGDLSQGRIPFAGCDHHELCIDPVSRNAVVSRLNPGPYDRMRRGRRGQGRPGQFWRQPHLWSYVMDVLCAVAWDVREQFECCEVATDGYMVRSEDAERVVAFVKEAWCLDSRVKDPLPGRLLTPALSSSAPGSGRWIEKDLRAKLRAGRLRILDGGPRWGSASEKTFGKTTSPSVSSTTGSVQTAAGPMPTSS